MHSIASIPIASKQASPAPKKKNGAGGEQGGSDQEFGEIFREQAGTVQSLPGTTNPSSAVRIGSSPDITAASEFSNIIGATDEDQHQSIAGLNSVDAATSVEGAVPKARHASVSKFLVEPGGAVKPVVVAAPAVEDSSDPTRMISGESGKVVDVLSSVPSKNSLLPSKEKDPIAKSERKTKVAAVLPTPAQMVTPVLPLPVLIPQVSGIVSIKVGTENTSIRKIVTPPSEQGSAAKSTDLPAAEPGQATVVAPPLPSGDNGIAQTIPGADFGFDSSDAFEAERKLDSSGNAGSSRPSPEAGPRAIQIVSDRLISGISAAGNLLEPLAAHNSIEAPAPAAQHSGSAILIASGVMQATGNNLAPGAPNVYDRIDQGATPVVLHSGLQHVSIGVHDPDLGWLEIQTQSAAGHVDAALITPSGQAHSSLAAQLPAMAQYLEQRDVRLGTLVVHHHAIGSGGSGSGSGGGAGYGSANSGAGAHHSNPGSSGGSRSAPSSGGSALDSLRPATRIDAGAQGTEEGAYRSVSYISVRA